MKPLPPPSRTERITGCPIATLRLAETVELLETWLGAHPGTEPPAGGARYFACANPHSLEIGRRDPVFREALHHAQLIIPDGVGIVLASRLLGGVIRERVCGPDVFTGLCARLNQSRRGTRLFFLGSSEENLAALAERFRRDYPHLVIAGLLAPPYRDEFDPVDDAAMIQSVNASRAELLWLGLGAPKQEKWAFRNRARLTVRLIGPIGGAFDFYTGRVQPPPRWMQRAGLQWLHRLCQEPRRLWRRNLDSPIFLTRVLRQLLLGEENLA